MNKFLMIVVTCLILRFGKLFINFDGNKELSDNVNKKTIELTLNLTHKQISFDNFNFLRHRATMYFCPSVCKSVSHLMFSELTVSEGLSKSKAFQINDIVNQEP